jgi:transposase
MDIDKDKRIQDLEATVTLLLQEIAELKRQLGTNSENSSKPPSSDKPGSKAKPIKPKRGKKKRGAQKGHAMQNKDLVPEEDVTHRVELMPEVCPSCGETHFQESDEAPLRDQFIDLPPIKPEVSEIKRPVMNCAACGQATYAPLPENTPTHVFGPGVVAMIGVLTGMLNISKRKAHLMMTKVFNVPMSLGAVSSSEARLSSALEQPYKEALRAAQKGAFGHADETGWPLGNLLRGWLWLLSNNDAAAFMVHESRGQKAAQELLGDFSGTLITDRWGGYSMYEGTRQICWAHLRRDFKAVSESSGWLGKTGKRLFDLTGKILGNYRRVKRISQWRPQLERWLKQGASHSGQLSAKCREIWKCRQWLWTFVDHDGVEPTNNLAERDVRQGVLWRKGSFGVQSERGAKYVERVLTIGATCRRQGKSVITFFTDACAAYHRNLPLPSLFG